jgi:hypothetical protein
MKQLSLSVLIVFLLLSSNLCLNLQQNKPKKKARQDPVRKEPNKEINEDQNVYLHSIRFSAKILKKLGDKRPLSDIKKEMTSICPTQNLIRTIRTDVINHKLLIQETTEKSDFISNLPIQTWGTMIQHIIDACPNVIKNSEAMTFFSAALKNLNNNHKRIKKLRKKTNKAIQRLVVLLNVTKKDVQGKLSVVKREIRKQKARNQAKVEHKNVVKILNKLEANVKRMKTPTPDKKKVTSISSEEIKDRKIKNNKKTPERLDDDKDFSVFPPKPDSKEDKKSSPSAKKSSFIEVVADTQSPKSTTQNDKIKSEEEIKKKSKTSKKKGNKKASRKAAKKKLRKTRKVPKNTKYSRELIRKTRLNHLKRQSLSSFFSKKIRYFAEKF